MGNAFGAGLDNEAPRERDVTDRDRRIEEKSHNGASNVGLEVKSEKDLRRGRPASPPVRRSLFGEESRCTKTGRPKEYGFVLSNDDTYFSIGLGVWNGKKDSFMLSRNAFGAGLDNEAPPWKRCDRPRSEDRGKESHVYKRF